MACASGGNNPTDLLTNIKLMDNTELTLAELKNCNGGAGWLLAAGYIIAKEGTKAIEFYRDLADNLSDGESVGNAIVNAGHSSGTIED